MTKSKGTEVEVHSGRSYYCAGRNCSARETCHRHTSSVQVGRAEFDDYDIVMLHEHPKPCKYFINIVEAQPSSISAN
jgi:hypothetical protein